MNFLFSIITPIYKTPKYKLKRLYNSLLNQTYTYWEWIVYDDSPSEYKEAYDYINELSKDDIRIKLYTNNKNSGSIGEIKRKAFSLGEGEILVEVDHDDELVDTCLENLSIAYNYSNEIGFVYGHACELFEDNGGIIDYGDNWAFGYGRYQISNYNDIDYKVAIVGNINPKTIRHITGIPNHVRSWKRNIYNKIGKHNKNLQVADDYELLVRTFLNTKIAKINVFTYIQYFERDSTNTQFIKNSDIQEMVQRTSKYYNKKIHDRFLEFGIDDYIWIDDSNFNSEIKNPETETFANIIIPENLLRTNLINNIIEKSSNKDIYAYSRVYDIPSTLEYKKSEHYKNLISWIVKLTNCQSYLELGVEYGENIQEIKKIVKKCVGVDINEISNLENIDFYKMTTDEFFSINNNTFDIIFIDASHEFNQVKNDFNNSLNILNKYGIIILHDTDPITPELLSPLHCNDSYRIIDYIELEYNESLNIITLPIQETGMTFVMRKNNRRIYEII